MVSARHSTSSRRNTMTTALRSDALRALYADWADILATTPG